MTTELDFRECVEALDEVAAAFQTARKDLNAPSRYEADFAAFKLMEVVFRYVNAVSGIAMLPEPGSHLAPAWALLRSAFEIGLTAFWLTREDDWKEREARWLGWVVAEEDFQRKLGGDLRSANLEAADRFLDYAARLEQRRLAITRKLPMDSRERRPSIPQMLDECGVDRKYYIAYRIGSQFTHGGPSVCDSVFESGEGFIRLKTARYSEWMHPLMLGSWSVAQPGVSTLSRAGASPESLERIYAAHEHLRDLTLQ